MVSITVRNLDDELERRLRERALEKRAHVRGRSGRDTAQRAGREKGPDRKAGHRNLHELFKPLGGVELEIPPREPMPEPPKFD